MNSQKWKNIEATIYNNANSISEIEEKNRLVASAYNVFALFKGKNLQEEFELYKGLSEINDLDITAYKKMRISDIAKGWQVNESLMLETMKKIVATLSKV